MQCGSYDFATTEIAYGPQQLKQDFGAYCAIKQSGLFYPKPQTLNPKPQTLNLQKDVHPGHEEHHDNLFLLFNCCRGSREGCGAKALEP